MLDIVAPDEHELTLPVEREGVDQPEPRLARLASAGKAQPMTEQRPICDDHGSDRDNDDSHDHGDLQHAIVAERED